MAVFQSSFVDTAFAADHPRFHDLLLFNTQMEVLFEGLSLIHI